MAYDLSIDKEHRIIMRDYELVGLYHAHAIHVGLPNVPPLPRSIGVHARPYGPWEIPMVSFDLALA